MLFKLILLVALVLSVLQVLLLIVEKSTRIGEAWQGGGDLDSHFDSCGLMKTKV